MMSFVPLQARYVWLLAILLLVGCKSATEKDPAYHLAQGCFALQAYDTESYIVSTAIHAYGLAEVPEAEAEKFFVKPTRLGGFMLYDTAGKYLGVNLIHIERFANAEKRVEWEINTVEVSQGGDKIADTFTLVSPIDDLRLLQNGSSFYTRKADVALASTDKSTFNFVRQPDESCLEHPEAPLNAEVSPEFYTPKDPAEPVTGYVDFHTHIGFPKSMGSVVMSGGIFDSYGIKNALHDCDGLHGSGGAIDLLEMQRASGGDSGHSTRGYPHFDYWPRRDTVSHVQAYYRWIERAYLAGLRILVTHVTGNPTFCQLIGTIHITKLEGDCSPEDTVRLQTEYIYEIQDYIDAQSGGPGKGWFRVATSSEQAREFINDNKLAVVLGSEYSTLFDCRSSNEKCDADFIDRELEKIYDMGIRSVFPIHRFDNAFGGAQMGGGAGAAWMHLTSKMNTGEIDHIADLVNPWRLLFKPIGGEYFDMGECPEGVQGEREVYSMRKFIDEDFSLVTNALRGVPRVGKYLGGALDGIFLNKLEPIPDYALENTFDSSCNRRTLQPAGRHLVNRLLDKGMIVEVDHMSYATTMETMQILEARNYSGVVSSHGWLADKPTMLDKIYQLGGMAVSFGGQPTGISNNIQNRKEMIAKYGFEVGTGIGSDVQGVTSQSSGDRGFKPEYPFKNYDGTVTFTEPNIGDRIIDFEKEGIAHYGMFAEWVNNLEQVSEQQKNDSFEIFMNSAEAYLQMWARAESAAIE
ncbi:MAG: dipeptidase [Pseudomonadales bacterium]|nr:dipeptidase [Pseudomonadales bacterium]